MIYAATKPIEEYDVTFNGTTYGLYSEYGHKPEVLALLLLITPFGYDYELQDVATGEHRVGMRNIEVVEHTLESVIEGVTVKEHLQQLNPLEFYKLIASSDVTHLPIVEQNFVGNQETFEFIVGARAATWAEHYKGEVGRTGNVVRVNFGGTKNLIEVPEIIKMYEQTIKQGRKDDNKK